IDDHSRFCVCALLVPKATAKPVCPALAQAMRAYGIPDAVLTDHQSVHESLWRDPEVLFDRICLENGVRQLLTAPYSPTTTGKIERLQKTMRGEFFRDGLRHHRGVQAALDVWVALSNTEHPHQATAIVDTP